MIPTQSIRKTAFWLGLALPAFALLATVWVTHVTNGQFNAAFASVNQTYNILNIWRKPRRTSLTPKPASAVIS